MTSAAPTLKELVNCVHNHEVPGRPQSDPDPGIGPGGPRHSASGGPGCPRAAGGARRRLAAGSSLPSAGTRPASTGRSPAPVPPSQPDVAGTRTNPADPNPVVPHVAEGRPKGPAARCRAHFQYFSAKSLPLFITLASMSPCAGALLPAGRSTPGSVCRGRPSGPRLGLPRRFLDVNALRGWK